MPTEILPKIKDLVTDVSWNYTVNQKIPPFQPKAGVEWKIYQRDVDRVQEFRKCIECFLCQNVCHVLRDHAKKKASAARAFSCAWRASRCIRWTAFLAPGCSKTKWASGYCNITKCCTEVCPEEIHITDNAIIPLKERVVDEFYDPVMMLVRKIRGS